MANTINFIDLTKHNVFQTIPSKPNRLKVATGYIVQILVGDFHLYPCEVIGIVLDKPSSFPSDGSNSIITVHYIDSGLRVQQTIASDSIFRLYKQVT